MAIDMSLAGGIDAQRDNLALRVEIACLRARIHEEMARAEKIAADRDDLRSKLAESNTALEFANRQWEKAKADVEMLKERLVKYEPI